MDSIAIDEQNIDDVLRWLLNSGDASPFEPSSISLGSALELAFWANLQGKRPMTALQSWVRQHEYFKQCMNIVAGGNVREPQDSYRVLPYEFFCIRAAEDVLKQPWCLFLERFSGALREAGFKQLSHAIAGALNEIGTNVVQHSTFGQPSAQMNGIACYAVSKKSARFAVGDDGIGALSSLQNNPCWSHLTFDREAVRAIGQEHASRRTDQGEGQGYRELFDALASFDGTVRLRSGTGIFGITGAIDAAVAVGSNSPHISGVQLSVHCALK